MASVLQFDDHSLEQSLGHDQGSREKTLGARLLKEGGRFIRRVRRKFGWDRTRIFNDPVPPRLKDLFSDIRAAEREVLGFYSRPAPASPDISIVIPVMGHFHLTLQVLVSLAVLADRASFEVILFDNGSSDRTRSFFPSLAGIRYIRNEENLGFVGACNRGVQVANGEFIWFLNNDTIVLDGAADALLAVARADATVGLVGSKLVFPSGRLQEAGAQIFSDGQAALWGCMDSPLAPSFNYRYSPGYCSAASALINRKLFLELGGFDPLYSPAYYEDTDLAMQVQRLGLKVVYQPESVVVHEGGGTAGNDLTAGIKSYQVVNGHKFRAKWKAVLERSFPQPGPVSEPARRHRPPRALVVDSSIPRPDQDSGSIDMYNTLRILSRMGFRVSFLTVPVLGYDPKYTAMLQGQGIECVYEPFSSRFDKYLARFGADLDLVLLARPGVGGPWIDLVRKRAPRARIIYDTVDLHFLRLERQARLDGSRARLRRAADSRRIETGIMRKADATLVRSTVERALIQSINPGIRSILYPLAREIPEVDTPRSSGRAGLLFVGGFNHSPNRDAVCWFVQEVFPLVRACRPAAEFTIVGSRTPEEIRRLEGNGVKVLGYLEDLAPVYGSARVVVAPLRYGAGIKGKVAEAMLHGVPCVTTPVGAEGMSAEAGRDLLVCDSPRDMADQIVRLLDEDALWEYISQSASRLARSTFSMEASLLRLVRLFSELGLPPGAGHCPVCGHEGPFLIPARAESGLDLVCPACSAGPGLRMGAQALLDDLFPGKGSIKDVLAASAGTILGHRLPDVVLRRLPGVRRMEEALEAPPTGRIQPVGIIHYDPEGKSPLDGPGLSRFSALAGEMDRLVFVLPYDPARRDTTFQADGATYGRSFLGCLQSAGLDGECLWRPRPELGVLDTRIWIAWRV